jgi:hypothetical protein
MTTVDRLTFAALLLAVPLQYYFLGFSLPNFVIELFTGIFPPISEWLPFWLSSALWITEGKVISFFLLLLFFFFLREIW